MERRVLLAALLSILFMAFYANTAGRRFSAEAPEETPANQDQPVSAEPVAAKPAALVPLEDEDTHLLAGKDVNYIVGAESGVLREVVLKKFEAEGGEGPLVFNGEKPLVKLRIGSGPNEWRLTEATPHAAQYEVEAAEALFNVQFLLEETETLKISIRPSEPMRSVPVTIYSSHGGTDHNAPGQRSYGRLEANFVTKEREDQAGKHKRFYAPVKALKNVPRGTMQVTLADNYFCQSLKLPVLGQTQLLPEDSGRLESRTSLILPLEGHAELELYFGPRDYFYLKQTGFEQAFKIGILGQIGLMLLAMLDGIARLTHNYGLAIIVFSLLVSLFLAPFTLISQRSMKKMQALQPQMNHLMEKHKEDPQKLNREMMALYRENKVSPMSGCLPMLLQLPILIALFQAISHFIKLRGQSFLWIDDLSKADRLFSLPFSLPILGDGIHLLPILMALIMVVQTKMNQPATQANNPAAKMFSGPIFPVIFTVLFYHFPSGLVLYYLVNSLISLGIYWVVKK